MQRSCLKRTVRTNHSLVQPIREEGQVFVCLTMCYYLGFPQLSFSTPCLQQDMYFDNVHSR